MPLATVTLNCIYAQHWLKKTFKNIFEIKNKRKLHVIRMSTYHHPFRRRFRNRLGEPTQKDFIRFIISTRRLILWGIIFAHIGWFSPDFYQRDNDGSYYRKRYKNVTLLDNKLISEIAKRSIFMGKNFEQNLQFWAESAQQIRKLLSSRA